MAYDWASGRVILFGGSGRTVFNDCWAYNPGAQTWTELSPAGVAPSARYRATMAYDSAGHRVFMFGGANGEGLSLDDTWELVP
jgi:N-acetylneuraminic acid mutarotase